jgi:hypothetical protein
MAIAQDAMDKAVRMPTVNFNPAARSFVRLDAWMWFDPAAWQPVSVTASGGGNSVTVTATPGKVGVSGVPAGSTVLTGCAGGGRPYSAGGGTDCMINFSRSSGAEPGQQWHFQVSLTWNVTAVGAAPPGAADDHPDRGRGADRARGAGGRRQPRQLACLSRAQPVRAATAVTKTLPMERGSGEANWRPSVTLATSASAAWSAPVP